MSASREERAGQWTCQIGPGPVEHLRAILFQHRLELERALDTHANRPSALLHQAAQRVRRLVVRRPSRELVAMLDEQHE